MTTTIIILFAIGIISFGFSILKAYSHLLEIRTDDWKRFGHYRKSAQLKSFRKAVVPAVISLISFIVLSVILLVHHTTHMCEVVF